MPLCALFITLGSLIISAIAQFMVVADVSPPAPKKDVLKSNNQDIQRDIVM